MSGYQYLPALDDDQRHALRQSIEANGILQPVEVDEDGNILDGHHRWEIAQELGIDCPTRMVEGLDETGKRKYAITVNLMRRQMTPTVRGALVAQLRTEGMSVRRIAAETGIPKTTVERDLSRVPHGTPDAIQGADGKSYAATKPPASPLSPHVADRPGADLPSWTAGEADAPLATGGHGQFLAGHGPCLPVSEAPAGVPAPVGAGTSVAEQIAREDPTVQAHEVRGRLNARMEAFYAGITGIDPVRLAEVADDDLIERMERMRERLNTWADEVHAARRRSRMKAVV